MTRPDVGRPELLVRGAPRCCYPPRAIARAQPDRISISGCTSWRPAKRFGYASPSCLEPFRGYIEARFVDDPHLEATVLLRELVDAGLGHSYQTLVRELRRLELRPECAPTATQPPTRDHRWEILMILRMKVKKERQASRRSCSIYDLAAPLYGYGARGEDFLRLRSELRSLFGLEATS